MIMYVFVYGTLLEGFDNNPRYLPRGVRAKGTKPLKAELSGYQLLVPDDYLTMFPYMVPAGTSNVVKGELFQIAPEHAEHVRTRLDFLEGYREDNPAISHYRRIREIVTVASTGEKVEAWTYVGNRITRQGMVVVPDGDWGGLQRRIRRDRTMAW